jgi:ferredoxin
MSGARQFSIEFVNSGYRPVMLCEGAVLSEHLSVGNSPLLFGCRTGICGTCVIRLQVLHGAVTAPSADERELLDLIAPGDARARLACQLTAVADLRIERRV